MNRQAAIHHLPVRARQQRGAVLFISLMFLIILTVIGLSAANVGILQERMAANVRESNEAFQRAEAALAAIELELGNIVSGASGGSLEIEIWEDARDLLNIGRHSCTLTRLGGGKELLSIEEEDVWNPITIDGFQAEYFIVALTDSPEAGTIFGSACRPMNELNDTAIEEYYVITTKARGRGDADRSPAEAVVQSIYFYPE